MLDYSLLDVMTDLIYAFGFLESIECHLSFSPLVTGARVFHNQTEL